jgi:2-aminoethylphosphonate-pyruvate transaminase
MGLHSRDPILLTPGPLTTSLPTKMAMLRDWGSWAAEFNAVTAQIRHKLTDIVHARESHTCVPLQGSGTFAIEAAVNTLVPRAGHVLVLINGAYGKRYAKLTEMMGRRLTTFETPDDVPTTADDVEKALAKDPTITHVGLIHCRDVDGYTQSRSARLPRWLRASGGPHRGRDELPTARCPSTHARRPSTR